MASILIIDDEVSNAELAKVYLEADGHHVHIECTGMEGYDVAQQADFDLILLDLRMPEFSWTGYTTAKNLKANQLTRHIPVIALTAAGDINLAIQSGCDDVIMRPYKRHQLHSILDHYLDQTC